MIGINLAEVRGTLLLYCKALTGKSIQILSTQELVHRDIGWITDDRAATEGSTIFLPPLSDGFESRRENFEFYKVLVTHQAGHLEYGTFTFSFARSAALFEDCRSALVVENRPSVVPCSDFEAFFDLFGDRRLAEDLFVVAEDTRVDALLRHNYRGIRNAHTRVRLDSASQRTPIHRLPLREAFVEVLVQLSLESDIVFPFPARYLDNLRLAAGFLRLLKEPGSHVEDAAEATIRLYCLLAAVPNVLPGDLPSVQVSAQELLHGEDVDGIIDRDRWLDLFRALPKYQARLEGEKDYTQAEDVQFRGGLKPELVQTIMLLLEPGSGGEEESLAVSATALESMIGKSVEVEKQPAVRSLSNGHGPLVDNLLKLQERAKHMRSPEKMSYRSKLPRKTLPIAIAGEEMSFYYDEWDFLANSYRLDWCRVRQTTLAEGSGRSYEIALKNHSRLLAQIRRQFSLLRPVGFKRVRGLQDGEEIDLDAVVESVVDRRAGQAQSDRLYSQRRKMQRDVSVIFLLDMSSSTGETIKDGPLSFGSYSPNVNRGPNEKRIIDIETESLILLTNTLEAIGDKYGIYGFSGSGRDNAQIFLIKGLNETFTEKVKKRIDSIRPVRGTRMGPAIRHASAILEKDEARTRLLILISDGRPQDLDYGQDLQELHFGGPHGHFKYSPLGEEDEELRKKEYAIHDTRMALLEAKRRGIVPFCFSIDKFGHDYMRIMCGDMGYEVVENVEALPRRLTSLYRQLTT